MNRFRHVHALPTAPLRSIHWVGSGGLAHFRESVLKARVSAVDLWACGLGGTSVSS
jgi:hypothetical protein